MNSADVELRPLVVDLDGTLIRSDLLIESAFGFFKSNPQDVLMPLIWLSKGKAHLKTRLCEKSAIDVSVLPYNQAVLEHIQKHKQQGGKVVLATASHWRYAHQIAEHLQLFDQVFATDEQVNLSSTKKRDKLVAEFGEQGFDYMGNSKDDLIIWQSAHHAYLVNPELGVTTKANQIGNVQAIFSENINSLTAWLSELRLYQWVKNLLLFVPLLASHQVHNMELVSLGLLAFLLFGLCSSSVYMLNDLTDLEDDRHHHRKHKRPFASGSLSIKAGFFSVPILMGLSFLGAFLFMPWKFTLVLLTYYLITLLYSVYLKKKVMVDVITLAILYTLRIIAGIFAFSVTLTFWILAFSMFIFLSLAFVKRYIELMNTVKMQDQIINKQSEDEENKTRGRDYYTSDLAMISSLGGAAGYLSVLVLAFYIQDRSTTVLYTYPELIWLACPLLLYWISRVWLLAHRGRMHDDPIVFAIKDKVSLVVGLLFGFIFLLAL